jgi:hypothetical protein
MTIEIQPGTPVRRVTWNNKGDRVLEGPVGIMTGINPEVHTGECDMDEHYLASFMDGGFSNHTYCYVNELEAVDARPETLEHLEPLFMHTNKVHTAQGHTQFKYGTHEIICTEKKDGIHIIHIPKDMKTCFLVQFQSHILFSIREEDGHITYHGFLHVYNEDHTLHLIPDTPYRLN